MANLFEVAPATIRPPLLSALETAWSQLAETGAWLTGAQRVAVVAEARHAWSCGLCGERKTALSPYTVTGEHDQLGDLPSEWVDVIHIVATDSGRLTQSWFSEVLDAGIEEDEFIEIIGVAILAITIDAFVDGIGVELAPLSAPQLGTPPRERWERATPGPGWVSTTAPENAGPELEDHYVNGRGQFNIVRSLTLVPTAATQLFALLDCLYMPNPGIHELEGIDRSISRAQIEFLAARSSSLFGCFYWTTGHAMRLRVSGQHTGDEYDMHSVVEGVTDTSGLPQGDLMNAFAEGICNRNPAQTEAARKGIVATLGEAAMVDAAAVIAAFNAYPRAADATGIPIEEFKLEPTADLRKELALDALPSRH